MENSSENPFRPAFWLGTVDPRPFAIFRIGLGLVILHDLFDFSFNLRAFITDEGMLPRGTVGGFDTWSLFDLVGSTPAVIALYAAGVLAVVAFTLGLWTRLATAASWLFLISLLHRNHYVFDGGDDLVRILLFWGMFADLGGAYSLDAWRRPGPPARIAAFGPRLLQLHVAVLNFQAGRLKVRAGWLHENAIYSVLQLNGFTRPPGALLGRFPLLTKLLGRMVMVLEMAFLPLAFSPWNRKLTRALAIAASCAVQLGILFTIRVGVFTEAMLVSMALYLQPEWIDWVESKFRKVVTPEPTAAPRLTAARALLMGALVAQFTIAVWAQFVETHLHLPTALKAERDFMSMAQPMGLFDVIYDVPHWNGPGVLQDGTTVEVLDAVVPGARPQAPGWSFSRWNKFLFKEREFPFRFAELATYLCRAYNEDHAPRLASLRLWSDEIAPHDEQGNAPPPRHRELWNQECPP